MTDPADWFVWAPHVRELTLQLEGTPARRLDQVRPSAHDSPASKDRGFFVGPAPEHGQRYRFVLDQGEPAADPRSRSQPAGVDGASEWVDPNVLRKEVGLEGEDTFQAPPWRRAVLYELHVGTFSRAGTLRGAAERLDYLVDLGVTHVELMPVGSFMGEFGWGYDVVFPYSVHAPYGGPEELMHFVHACHEKGLAVILDVIFNHLGPSGNVLHRFGPYFTDRYHTSWGDALNFDGPGSDQVRRYFLDNVSYWFEHFRVDGLRLDAIQAIFDGGALHFLEELSAHVAELESRLNRPLVLIAESHQNDPRLVEPLAAGGRGMDAMWSDDLHHALHALLTGERVGYYADHGSVEQVAKAIVDGFVLDGCYSSFYERTHGRPAPDTPSECFVVYLQNHDQVGNRARGDRIGHGIPSAALQLGMALVLLGPFVPLLFQGEEWNASAPFPFFADPPDDGLARAIRRGRRREYAHLGWKKSDVPDPVSRSTFESARLDWQELDLPEHRPILSWCRALLQLRKETGGCIPRNELAMGLAEGWLQFRRGPYLVMVNCTQNPGERAIWETSSPLASPERQATLRLSTPGVQLTSQHLHLPAWGVAVVTVP